MTSIAIAMVVVISAPRTFDLTTYSQKLFDGKKQAYGETYKHYGKELTCATVDYPKNARLRISWRGKSIVCRVTDKINRRYRGRRIDLNGTAWNALSGGKRPGIMKKALVKREFEGSSKEVKRG